MAMETRSMAAEKENHKDCTACQPRGVYAYIAVAIPLMLIVLGPIAIWMGVGSKKAEPFAMLGQIHKQQEGICRAASRIKIMAIFNRFLKLGGITFPFLVLIARIVLTFLFSLVSKGRPFFSWLWSLRWLAAWFVGMTILRMVVYGLTLQFEEESMSDHIFLGLSIASLARIELHEAFKGFSSQGGGNFFMLISVLLSLGLILLIQMNNFITCNYHTATESLTALVMGLLVFEIPASYFILARRTA
mmetsp:Transcript_44125/g.88643  ORF Transcript_44125/g.88643 Transcript_44125/m.88643 type:complete len:246 (+) Transcript_44125:25-762(+)